MVRVVKNREELEKLYKGRPVISIREEEYFFWIELKNGKGTYLEKVLKVLSLETIQKILLGLGFPPRVVKKLQETKKTDLTEFCLKTLHAGGVILTGPAGTGKTHAIIYAIAQLLRKYRVKNPLYISCPDMQDFKALREAYREADMIILDDVSKFLRDFHLDFVREVIYHAYNEEKRLAIISNLDIKDLFGLLAEEPIISRLREVCVLRRVEGADLRLKPKSHKGTVKSLHDT